MDCPHCGGVIDGGAPKPIERPIFDDARRMIVKGERSWKPSPSQWRLLQALRERFGRWVDIDFLALASAKSPCSGGSTEATKIRIMELRRGLEGTPFVIATSHRVGYGLFGADETAPVRYQDGKRSYHLRQDRPHPADKLTYEGVGSWPLAT